MIRHHKREDRAPTKGRDMALWDGVRFIVGARTVLRVILLLAAGSLFAWSVPTVFPLLSDKFHKAEAGYSAMMSAQGFGAALGGLAMATYANRVPRRLIVYGGMALQSLALLFVALAPHYYLALGGLALSGFALISFAIGANTKVQEDVPDALRGRVMAVYSLIQGGLSPVGGLAIGFAAERMGVSQSVGVFAVLCVLCVAALWVWSTTDRQSIRR
jgi:MFS family permease